MSTSFSYFAGCLALFSLLFATACGGDDDGATAGQDCDVELVSVTELDESDFTVRLKNNGSATQTFALTIRYQNNGVQLGQTGIGVAQAVAPGTTVDIETINGNFDLTRDGYDCAQIVLQVLTPGSGTPCSDEQIGQDCY